MEKIIFVDYAKLNALLFAPKTSGCPFGLILNKLRLIVLIFTHTF
jgi:hypothetical protein